MAKKKYYQIAVTEVYCKHVIVKADTPEEAYEEATGVEVNMSPNDYVSDSTQFDDAIEVTIGDFKLLETEKMNDLAKERIKASLSYLSFLYGKMYAEKRLTSYSNFINHIDALEKIALDFEIKFFNRDWSDKTKDDWDVELENFFVKHGKKLIN
jgi:hypothetical protein